jgi:hypothetical protein
VANIYEKTIRSDDMEFAEMETIKFIKSLKSFKECCGTCTFNLDGVCTKPGVGHGEKIINLDDFCYRFTVGMRTYAMFGRAGRKSLLKSVL